MATARAFTRFFQKYREVMDSVEESLLNDDHTGKPSRIGKGVILSLVLLYGGMSGNSLELAGRRARLDISDFQAASTEKQMKNLVALLTRNKDTREINRLLNEASQDAQRGNFREAGAKAAQAEQALKEHAKRTPLIQQQINKMENSAAMKRYRTKTRTSPWGTAAGLALAGAGFAAQQAAARRKRKVTQTRRRV